MNIGGTGYSQYNYAKLEPKVQDVNQNKQESIVSPSESLNEITEGKAATQIKQVESETPASGVEAFTYGALGMDHPNEVKNSDDGAYTAGQVLSALGTIGAVLAVVV